MLAKPKYMSEKKKMKIRYRVSDVTPNVINLLGVRDGKL